MKRTGGNYIDPVLVETLVFNREIGIPHESLSAREYQVFLMLVSGKSVGNIASELCLSIKTISTHKSRFMQKMNMQTKTELVRYAIRHKLIEG
ncbi:response regulator transcription factor [Gallionella capsiferriformans]|uniref:response regulator transcription factor n=1 Tax=Gallionella capsiferriformans TaxID=370405 RepID=UPI0037BFBAB5